MGRCDATGEQATVVEKEEHVRWKGEVGRCDATEERATVRAVVERR